MKPFKIGSYVRVSAIAEMQYDENKRFLARVPVEPFHAEVVGKAVKRLGTYQAASQLDWDYDPAYLQVTGSVTLWEVRTGMINRPILVHDDDLESVGGIVAGFPIPNRGIKPKRDRAREVIDATYPA